MSKEDISFKIGADTTGFGRAMRSMKGMAADAGKNVQGSFSSFGNKISGLFAVGSLVAAAKSISDMAEGILNLASATNVGTGFLQGYQQQVMAAGGTAEGANKSLNLLNKTIGEAIKDEDGAVGKFKEFGISVRDSAGHFRKTDEVIKDVSDVLAGTENASERARLAFEMFGKSYTEVLPVLLQGSKAMQDGINSASKLSDEDLKAMADYGDQIDGMIHRSKIWGGKAFGFVADVFKGMGTASAGGFNLNFAKPKPAVTPPEPLEDPEKVKKAFEKSQAAAAKFFEARMKDEEKLKKLKEETAALGLDIKYSKGIKQLELQAQQYEKLNAIAELNKKIEEAKIKKIEEQNQKLVRQQRIADDIADAQFNLDAGHRDVNQKREERSKFSIQDLAEMETNGWTTDEQHKNVRLANDVLDMEEEAARLARLGYTKESQTMFDKADGVRMGITSLTDSERFPYKSLDENIGKMSTALGNLLRKAGEEGININW